MTVIRSQCKDDAEYRTALRDDFAAAALTGMIATARHHVDSEDKPITTLVGYAKLAFEYADAMIAERDKP